MRENVKLENNQPLSGRLLFFTQFLWWVLFLLSVGIIAISIWIDPSYRSALGWETETYQTAVIELGWSTTLLDAIHQFMGNIIRMSYIGMGILIYWRKSRKPIALFISIFLITFSVTAVFLGETAQNHPLLIGPLTVVQTIGQTCVLIFFFIFPDGHFVPRWGRWPTIVMVIHLNLARIEAIRSTLVFQIFSFVALWIFACIPAQIYRYRHADSQQRQQIKWGILGIVSFVLFYVGTWFLFGYWLPQTLPALQQQSALALRYEFIRIQVMSLGGLSLPIALGIAVLRYRLWDIDVIIRRTLQYSLLTGLLALTYFGLIIVLQSAFTAITGQRDNPFITVISTLAIAALFNPLRRRVQDGIDRRFYRKKYDAAKTLAAFAATCRDETDLDKLTASLIAVVQETMQPEHVSLWLKDASHNAKSQPPEGSRRREGTKE